MPRIAAAAFVGIVIGALLGAWILRAEPASVPSVPASADADSREELARLVQSLERRIDALGTRIDAVAVPRAESLPARTPAPAESATSDDVAARLEHLERQLDALTKAIEAHRRVVIYPKVEQLRAARASIDWAEIARVSAALVSGREAGLSMVRYLTFDEVLERFGVPTTINADGNWFYERPEGGTLGPEAFELDFVNGYVVGLHSTDE